MIDVNKRDSMEAGVPDMPKKFEDPQVTVKDVEDAIFQHLVSLTSLPSSVRNRIYSHVLDTELVNVGNSNVSYTHEFNDNTLRFKASRPPFPICSSLFYVNKQISEESRHFFYSKNLWVRFEIYRADARHAKNMLEDSGVLFAVAEEDMIVRAQQHALDLTLVEKNSSQKRATVMFPAQYLPRLINFMEQANQAASAWARGHAIFLTLREVPGTDIASVQGDLLEGFRALTGFSKSVVQGKDILPGYADGLQESMMAETFDVDAWFNILNDILARGEEHRTKNQHQSATQQCRTAIIALTYGYLTRTELLHSQPEAFHKHIQRLRYNLERTLAASSLAAVASSSIDTATLDWLTAPAVSLSTRHHTATALLAAETASSHALSLCTDSPSPSTNPWYRSLPPELIPPNNSTWFTNLERARAWLELGKAHYSLGECLFAAGDLERADRLLMEEVGLKPDDVELMAARSEVKMCFERAREGIDWNVRPGSSLKRVALLAKTAHEK